MLVQPDRVLPKLLQLALAGGPRDAPTNFWDAPDPLLVTPPSDNRLTVYFEVDFPYIMLHRCDIGDCYLSLIRLLN